MEMILFHQTINLESQQFPQKKKKYFTTVEVASCESLNNNVCREKCNENHTPLEFD